MSDQTLNSPNSKNFSCMGALFGLTVSTSYIILSCLIAWWARKLADKVWPKSTIAKCLFLEGIATWELCSTCFELIIVADNYGVLTYGLYLFLLTIWWSQVWGDSSACPYTHIEEVVEGGLSPVVAVTKILAELAGGALTFRSALGWVFIGYSFMPIVLMTAVSFE